MGRIGLDNQLREIADKYKKSKQQQKKKIFLEADQQQRPIRMRHLFKVVSTGSNISIREKSRRREQHIFIFFGKPGCRRKNN